MSPQLLRPQSQLDNFLDNTHDKRGRRGGAHTGVTVLYLFSDSGNLAYMLRRNDGTKGVSRRCESTRAAKNPNNNTQRRSAPKVGLFAVEPLDGEVPPWRTALCPERRLSSRRETSVVCAATLSTPLTYGSSAWPGDQWYRWTIIYVALYLLLLNSVAPLFLRARYGSKDKKTPLRSLRAKLSCIIRALFPSFLPAEDSAVISASQLWTVERA